MNADGSNQTNLTNNTAPDIEPAWSPDGTRIAFHSERDGNGDIYVMNANGSNQTQLTNNTAMGLQARLVARRNPDRVHQRSATATARSMS